MDWESILHPDFEAELVAFSSAVQTEIAAASRLLRSHGPFLGRPRVDTLKGSTISNLKEFRFFVGREPWRLAFVFDPSRQAIFLVAGSKSGMSSALFYTRLIKLAEKRYRSHVKGMGMSL